MKQFLSTLAIVGILIFSTTGASAKIWRLNNSNGQTLNPAINADFTGTIQQAHDDSRVQNGDTLHVEQSSVSYGNLNISKRLVIIGPGYFMSENPKTQVNKSYGATIGAISILGSVADYSVVSGLTITGAMVVGASKVIVENNYFAYTNTTISVGSGNSSAIDSVVFRSNYFAFYTTGGYFGITTRPSTSGQITNFIFSNNIVTTTNTWGLYLGSLFSGIIRNNTFYGSYNMYVYNMYVVNNLSNYINVYVGGNGFENCVLEYNMGINDNQYVIPFQRNVNNVITNCVTNTDQLLIGGTETTDGQWALQPASPAKGTGKGGADLGAFGGSVPYVLSGLPRVPNIYSLNIAPINPGATSISVTVSAKSN